MVALHTQSDLGPDQEYVAANGYRTDDGRTVADQFSGIIEAQYSCSAHDNAGDEKKREINDSGSKASKPPMQPANTAAEADEQIQVTPQLSTSHACGTPPPQASEIRECQSACESAGSA